MPVPLMRKLGQSEKCDFTTVNDHFEDKHNEDSKLYGQTLISYFNCLKYICIVFSRPKYKASEINACPIETSASSFTFL